MLIDSRELPHNCTREADLCIIGAGAAGITLARQFTGFGLRVALLESGGLEREPDRHDLLRGQFEGPFRGPNDLTNSRCRYFGGTTNRWWGTCRPLDAIDFEERPWIADSGWPIGSAELEPFYRRSAEIVNIPEFEEYEGDGQLLAFNLANRQGRPRVVPKRLYRSNPPTRFGEAYRRELEDAPDVDVYLWANVLDLGRKVDGERIESARVASHPTRTFSLRAKRFVLSAGGFDIPRILLNSDLDRGGLGNHNDLVGRYYMDHTRLLVVGNWFSTDTSFGTRRARHRAEAEPPGQRGQGYQVFTPTARVQREEHLLNCGLVLHQRPARHTKISGSEPYVESYGLASALDGTRLGHGRLQVPQVSVSASGMVLDNVVKFYNEHIPLRHSRVQLLPERDPFGQRRIKVDWRTSDQMDRSVRTNLELFAREFGRANRGRLRIGFRGWSPPYSEQGRLASHHMGTTRMSRDPRQGVVDANCKVHGLENLFVASSSVFPTGGFANPTLTILALTLRLADHLQKTGES